MDFDGIDQSFSRFCNNLSRFEGGKQAIDMALRIISVGNEKGFLSEKTFEGYGNPTKVMFIVFDETNLIYCTSSFANDPKDLVNSFIQFKVHPMLNRQTKSIDFEGYKLIAGLAAARFMRITYTFGFDDGFELKLCSQNEFEQSFEEFESTIRILMMTSK